MITVFDIIQSVMAVGIIIFSIVSIYYGIRIVVIHINLHGRLMQCCWLMIVKTLIHFIFGLVFFVSILSLLFKEEALFVQGSLIAIILEPVIFLNSIINSIYTKRSFINAKNEKKIEGVKHG